MFTQIGMIASFGGLVLSSLGWVFSIDWLLIPGGSIAILFDIYGAIKCGLKPYSTIVAIVLAVIASSSWKGIFYGVIISTALELMGTLLKLIEAHTSERVVQKDSK